MYYLTPEKYNNYGNWYYIELSVYLTYSKYVGEFTKKQNSKLVENRARFE